MPRVSTHTWGYQLAPPREKSYLSLLLGCLARGEFWASTPSSNNEISVYRTNELRPQFVHHLIVHTCDASELGTCVGFLK